MKEDNVLQVYYEEKRVGILALTADHKAAFQYDEKWLENGFSISPFSLPLKKQVFLPTKDYFSGLFGVFADSLPDNWGRLLLNRLLREHKQNPDKLTVLDRLAIVGKSGMGALTYYPERKFPEQQDNPDLDELARECQKILNTEYTDKLDELYRLGGTSGGARPKIMTSIGNEEWIIKFFFSLLYFISIQIHFLVVMKGFRTLLCVISLALSGVIVSDVMAQKELGVFNSLAVGVGVGTTGIDVNVATPITSHFDLRGGFSIMPNFSMSTDVDVDVEAMEGVSVPSTIGMEGSIKRVSGELLVNYYPFKKGSFFLTAGAYFGGGTLLKINGHSDELKELVAEAGKAGVVIGDYTIPVDKNGNVSGGLKVSNFRPYVGLGFGRAVPKKRLGVMFELGVQFHGKPDVYTDYGNVNNLLDEVDPDDTFSKIMDKLTVYPVMKIRLCGRIF